MMLYHCANVIFVIVQMLYLQTYDMYWDSEAVQHGLKSGTLIQVYKYT